MPPNRFAAAGVTAFVALVVVVAVAISGGESTTAHLASAINKSYVTHGTACTHESGDLYDCEIATKYCSGILVVKPVSESFTIEEARPESLRDGEQCDNSASGE
jgi:hypothetical protein